MRFLKLTSELTHFFFLLSRETLYPRSTSAVSCIELSMLFMQVSYYISFGNL